MTYSSYILRKRVQSVDHTVVFFPDEDGTVHVSGNCPERGWLPAEEARAIYRRCLKFGYLVA